MKKRILVILFVLFLVIFGIACGNKDNGGNEDGGNKEVYYTVKFENCDVANQTIKAGEKLEKPADPSKAKHIFGGWYLDSGFNTEAVFPITVNSDIKIYANFYSYKVAFEKAREKTIGDDVNAFQYDYSLEVSATYKTYILNGSTTGNTQYSKNSEISFYDEHTNFGTLLFDGTKYLIKKGTTLQRVSVNKEGKVKNVTVETVDSNYKFDTSSFAKALFEYTSDQLKEIEKTSNSNEYKLNTSFNATKGIALVGNYLNHPIIEKILGELPETSVNAEMLVTFTNGEIKTYKYIMNVNVANITFSLTYLLTFKELASNYNISPKTFAGVSVSSNDIATDKAKIANVLNAFKQQSKSSYDFVFKNGVDYGLTVSEINTTVKGSAIRKIDGSMVYFHNDIEIDSDLKNADLYKDANLADIHIKKTKLASGEVYNIEKKLLADKTYLVENYQANNSDNYYLFDVYELLKNITYIQTINNTKENTVEYVVGISKSDLILLLNYFNQINLDPLARASKQVKVFGTFEANSIVLNEAELIIEVQGGVLKSIEVEANGVFNTKFEDSRDFTFSRLAAFDFDFEIEVTNDASKYEPYTKVNDAK